jgi:hypothetical protein
MTPEQVRDALSGELPPATLVLGAGAWELLQAMACPDWTYREDIDAATVRLIRLEVTLRATGQSRVAALAMDGVTPLVQTMLLKLLEEAPPDTRFVLAAETAPLPTVASRCRLLLLGQVRQEIPPADPKDVAAVGAAIRAARTGRIPVLAGMVRDWFKAADPGRQPEQARLLSAWAVEAASGQWKAFTPDLAPGVTPEQALTLLAELDRFAAAKLAPVAALERAFSRT